MDLLQMFLPSVGVNPRNLTTTIEHSPYLWLATKYSAMVDELAKARTATLGAVTIKSDGAVQVCNQPGMAGLQSRIAELEPKIARLVGIAAECGKLLESLGIDPRTEEFRERRNRLIQNSEISPAAWQRYTMLHNQQPLKLPGEIYGDAEYLEYEKTLLDQRATALADLEVLNKQVSIVDGLLAEAGAL